MKPTITVIFRDGTRREFKHASVQLDGCVSIRDGDGEEHHFPWDLIAEVVRDADRRF